MAENDFVFAKWAWQAKDVGEVTFDKGECFKVVERNGEWWRGVFPDGRQGWFPALRVRPLTGADEIAQLQSALAAANIGGDSNGAGGNNKAANGATDSNLLNDLEALVDDARRRSKGNAAAEVAGGPSKEKKKDKKLSSSSSSNGAVPPLATTTAPAAAASAAEALASPRGGEVDGVMYVRAKWAWQAKAPTELTMAKGDLLRVTKQQGEWWKGRTKDGQHGWFPSARVVPVEAESGNAEQVSLDSAVDAAIKSAKPGGGLQRAASESAREPAAPAKGAKDGAAAAVVVPSDDAALYFRAKWGWKPRAEGELAFEKGQEIRVSQKKDEWWKGRTTDGVSGWFPKDRVRPVTDAARIQTLEAMFKALASERRTTTRSKSIRDEDVVMAAAAAGPVGRPPTPPGEPGEFVAVSPPSRYMAAPPVPPDDDDDEAPPPVPVEADLPVASTKKAEPLDSILDDLDGLERKQGQQRRAPVDDKLDLSALDDLLVGLNPRSQSRSMFEDDADESERNREAATAAAAMLRERDAAAQREKDAAAQRERDAAAQREKDAAAQREKDAAAQRERDAAAQRERDAAAQRERDAAAQRERDAAAQRERDAAAQRERDAAAQRDRDALAAKQAAADREKAERERREKEEKQIREEKAAAAEKRRLEDEKKRAQEEEKKRALEQARVERERAQAEAEKVRLERENLARERERIATEARARAEREAREAADREEEKERARVAAELEAEEREVLARRERLRREAEELEEEKKRLAKDKKQREEEAAREAARVAAERERQERERRAAEERARQEREREERERAERERRLAVQEKEARERRERIERARAEEEAERLRIQREKAALAAERDALERTTAVVTSRAVGSAPSATRTTTATVEVSSSKADTSDLDALLGDLDSFKPSSNSTSTTTTTTTTNDTYHVSNDIDFGETLAKSDSSKIASARAYESAAAAAVPQMRTSRMGLPSGAYAAAQASQPIAPPFALSSRTPESVAADGGRRVTLTGLERDVLGLLRRLRTDPQYFIDLIERFRLPYFDGDAMLLTSPVDGSRMRFITAEGRAAAEDAIRELRRIASGLPLTEPKLSAGMTLAAKQGLPENSSFGCIRQFGRFEGKVVECCAFDQHTAEDIVLQLLIDDGDDSRTKRKMLLDRQFQHVGVAADDQRCLINLAFRFTDK